MRPYQGGLSFRNIKSHGTKLCD